MTTTARAELQDLLDRWAEAIVSDDPDAIDWFMEPDWVLVTPEGGPRGREHFLAFVASGDLTHSEMGFKVLDARVHGDTAVVIAHGTNRGEWRGEPFVADEWVTEVFIRRDDRWRCAMSALTPNYAAAAPPPKSPGAQRASNS